MMSRVLPRPSRTVKLGFCDSNLMKLRSWFVTLLLLFLLISIQMKSDIRIHGGDICLEIILIL